MPQKNSNTQVQVIKQTQSLTPQQVLEVRLLEMPVQQLEERVNQEVIENEALEEGSEEREEICEEEEYEGNTSESILADPEDNIEATEPQQDSGTTRPSFEQLPFSNDETFNDILLRQIGEFDVTDRQREILEYLIGYLESDGLLHKDLSKIADDLVIYFNFDVSDQELQECLNILQQFDPAGIGARSIQECLLLQIDRKENDPLKPLKHRVIEECYDEFSHKKWKKISDKLEVPNQDVEDAIQEITKLNPRPGISLGESVSKNLDTIVPDFILDIDDYGNITVQLNNGHVPQLHISQSFSDALNEYIKNKDRMSKDARTYMASTKDKIDKARGFIDAIKSRQNTMLSTMKSIIHFQKEFFLEGDETLLIPLTMKTVAEKAKVDISTVSRVCNSKFVQTPYGIFPLNYFFGNSIQNGDGEDVATRTIRAYLKEVIDKEDKHCPLTDEKLVSLLKEEKGYNVARRTVAKYRAQLNIPTAKMRKI